MNFQIKIIPSERIIIHMCFSKKVDHTLNKLRELGFKISFFGSWYTNCKGKNIECFEKKFNLNRMSLRIFDNSFASYLSNGFLGKKFHLF